MRINGKVGPVQFRGVRRGVYLSTGAGADTERLATIDGGTGRSDRIDAGLLGTPNSKQNRLARRLRVTGFEHLLS